MAFNSGLPGATPKPPKLSSAPSLSGVDNSIAPMKSAAGFGSIRNGAGLVAKNTKSVRNLKTALKRSTQPIGEKIARFGRN